MAVRNYLNTVEPTSLVSTLLIAGTSVHVADNTGFPTPPYTIAIDRGEPGEEEVCLVTAHPDATHMTVTRGWDGTAAVEHDAGKSVEHAVAAVDYQDANHHVYDTGQDHHTQYLNTTRHNALSHSTVLSPYLPLGAVILYSDTGDVAPNLLVADGRAISRATYSAYFALVGTAFGTGDGSTTFNIPDLRGRVPIGMDNPGTAQGAANRMTAAAADTQGGTGGTETVTLVAGDMPAHTHVQNAHTHIADSHAHTGTASDVDHRHEAAAGNFLVDVNSGGSVNFGVAGGSPITKDVRQYTDYASHGHSLAINTTVVTLASTTAVNQSSGGSGAHRNDQPWLAMTYLVRVL